MKLEGLLHGGSFLSLICDWLFLCCIFLFFFCPSNHGKPIEINFLNRQDQPVGLQFNTVEKNVMALFENGELGVFDFESKQVIHYSKSDCLGEWAYEGYKIYYARILRSYLSKSNLFPTVNTSSFRSEKFFIEALENTGQFEDFYAVQLLAKKTEFIPGTNTYSHLSQLALFNVNNFSAIVCSHKLTDGPTVIHPLITLSFGSPPAINRETGLVYYTFPNKLDPNIINITIVDGLVSFLLGKPAFVTSRYFILNDTISFHESINKGLNTYSPSSFNEILVPKEMIFFEDGDVLFVVFEKISSLFVLDGNTLNILQEKSFSSCPSNLFILDRSNMLYFLAGDDLPIYQLIKKTNQLVQNPLLSNTANIPALPTIEFSLVQILRVRNPLYFIVHPDTGFVFVFKVEDAYPNWYYMTIYAYNPNRIDDHLVSQTNRLPYIFQLVGPVQSMPKLGNCIYFYGILMPSNKALLGSFCV